MIEKATERRNDLGGKILYSVLTLIICGFLSASFFTGIVKAEKAQDTANTAEKKVDILSEKFDSFVDSLKIYCNKQDNINEKILDKLEDINKSVIEFKAKRGE